MSARSLLSALALLSLVGSFLAGTTGALPTLSVDLSAGPRDGHTSPPAGVTPTSPPFAPGRLIVKLRPEVQPLAERARVPATGYPSLDAVLANQQVQSAARLFPEETLYGVAGAGNLSQVYVLQLPADSDVLQAVAAFSQDANVEWAEPDYLAHPADITPNDPFFADQWGLAQIQAPAAWDVVTGTPAVVIAIVDSGLQLDHPDLAGNVWVNPGEIPGNGLDDDNNGFVDDVYGWDFVSEVNDPSDDDGHGTQVAGVAGAVTDNGLGVAGVCWNCRLMAVKVMQGGVANYSDIAQGILYAAQKGAKVINLSLGGYSDSQAVRAAVQAAVEDYGAVLVAGAGNDDMSTSFYPAAYPEVLAVAGTDSADVKWSGSNYGPWVDLSAPAVAITTTYLGGDYGPADGTSFATPFVAGLAGLVCSQHPGWSPELVWAQLYHTADPIDALNPAHAGLLGSGRINAAAAVTQEPHPLLTIAATAVNGDPQGRPTPGERATLQVTLDNGWLDAAGVLGVLATADPYATVVTDTAAFGNIPAGGEGAGIPLYVFDVDLGAGYNHPVPFTLEVASNGGDYTATLALTITTRSAEEPVGGTIFTHTVWTNDKTYVVGSNVGIMPGITLTIEPGTEIHFNGDYSLNVGGMLIADGTEAQPIRFRPHQAGSTWGRIYFDDTSVDATATVSGTYLAGNVLRWVQVEGAAQGIGCNGATPYLGHMTTDGGGINCALGSTVGWLYNSDIAGNASIVLDMGSMPGLGGQWTDRSSMPSARSYLGAAAPGNGKIYAIGGFIPSGSATGIVEEYDPAMDSWVTRTSMPTARSCVGGVTTADGKIYVIGGWNGEFLYTVEEYDPATDTWTARTDMPTFRAYPAVVAANNGKIYVIGGEDAGWNPLPTVEEYDPLMDTWTSRADMPTARGRLAAVTAGNGKIYAIGGWDGSSYLNTVEAYDPATNAWTTYSSMPTARIFPGAAVGGNGKIYAIGGETGAVLATVEEYDPATDTWTIRAPLPVGLTGLGTTGFSNGKIYTMGGTDGGPFYDTVYAYTSPSSSFGYHVLGSTVRPGSMTLPICTAVLTSTVEGSITAGDNSLVRNATTGGISIGKRSAILQSMAGGDINLNSGTVQECTVTGASIQVDTGQVLSNTVRGGGILLSSGGLVQGNDVEGTPDVETWPEGAAIAAHGPTTIVANRVVGSHGLGIWTSGDVVQGNLVANSTGVGLYIEGNTAVVSNTLTGNAGSAVKIVAATAMTITGTNLELNTGAYDIENLVLQSTMATIAAQDNWWGTTDPAWINQRIYDFLDDYNLGQVLYTPVATGPVQTAPAYVRSVTVDPNPVGIETATFDITFSRPMDPGRNPQMSFWDPPYWTTRAPMPTARQWLGVATASNGKLYAIGGFSNGHLATVEEYDPEIDTWTTRAPMPTARHGLGVAAASNGKIYAIGGESNSNVPVATVEEYDPATDTWTTRAPMPTARQWLGVAAASNGKLYAIGGEYTYERLATVEEYDPATDTWTTRAPMPTARQWFGVATASNDRLYAIGGYSSTNGAEEYDPAMDTWTTRAPMPTARWGLAVGAASNGRLYAIGGAVNTYLTTAEEYDPATDTWTRWAPMPTARYGLGVGAASNGKLYAIGGYGGADGNDLATVEELTPRLIFSAFYDGHWLSATQYRAYYDITALVPLGTYTITAQGAVGGDGITIASNSAFTFTVDYAGEIGDTTPPPPPTVLACGATTPDTLSAQWWAHDPDSEITLYRYAIGSTPGGVDVVNWTTTPDTAFLRTGLGLIAGQTYYVAVQARNEGGLWSEPGVSSGVVAGAGTCPEASFTAAPVSGTVPLAVQFTDASTGTVEAWQWAFGDGVTSTVPNPAHTYTAIGSYTVTLLASGPGGSDLLVRPHYITVLPTGTLDYQIYLPLVMRGHIGRG